MQRIFIAALTFAALALTPAGAAAQGYYTSEACTPWRGVYGELSGDNSAVCVRSAGYTGYYSSGQATAGYYTTGWGNYPTSYRERAYSPWGGYTYCAGWYC